MDLKRLASRFGSRIEADTSATTRGAEYMRLTGGSFQQLSQRVKEECGNKAVEAEGCITEYSKESPLYRNLNTALRRDRDIEDYAAFIFHLKQQIKQRRMYHGTVYRKMQLSKREMAVYRKKGRRFLWAGFVSTTYDKQVAKDFPGNVLFKIHCNDSSKGALGVTYAASIVDESVFPQEKEVLIYTYSGFIVQDFVMLPEGKVEVTLATCDTLSCELYWTLSMTGLTFVMLALLLHFLVRPLASTAGARCFLGKHAYLSALIPSSSAAELDCTFAAAVHPLIMSGLVLLVGLAMLVRGHVRAVWLFMTGILTAVAILLVHWRQRSILIAIRAAALLFIVLLVQGPIPLPWKGVASRLVLGGNRLAQLGVALVCLAKTFTWQMSADQAWRAATVVVIVLAALNKDSWLVKFRVLFGSSMVAAIFLQCLAMASSEEGLACADVGCTWAANWSLLGVGMHRWGSQWGVALGCLTKTCILLIYAYWSWTAAVVVVMVFASPWLAEFLVPLSSSLVVAIFFQCLVIASSLEQLACVGRERVACVDARCAWLGGASGPLSGLGSSKQALGLTAMTLLGGASLLKRLQDGLLFAAIVGSGLAIYHRNA